MACRLNPNPSSKREHSLPPVAFLPVTASSEANTPSNNSPTSSTRSLSQCDHTELDRACWPDWVTHHFEVFHNTTIHRAMFLNVVHLWIDLESSYGFSASGRNLPSGNQRPEEIAFWISRGRGMRTQAGKTEHRDLIVPVNDLAKLTRRWWVWWNGIQPSWRRTESTRSSRSPLPRPPISGNWGPLAVAGKNGMLTPVYLLHTWWRHLLAVAAKDTGAGEVNWRRDLDKRQVNDWELAVNEVHWVLTQLIEFQHRQ